MAALPGNLDGTRVLDLTREPGFFAGKLLGDLGADVLKVEPPGGDPARRRPPFWGGIADPERSLLWLAMNTSKRGVTLDLARPRGRSLPVSYYHGGIEAALGVAFALLARERTGEGQHVDVAFQEAMVMPNIGTAAMWKMTGNRGARAGAFMRQERSVAREIWPCKDGFVSFALRGGPARIPGLVAMVKYMDEHGMASAALRARDWKAYNHNLLTQAEVDELSREFGAFFLTKTMGELYRAACERNLMLAPINNAREIAASTQLAAREFFVEVE